MSSPGATELLIVLVIVLLIFGPKRLPALGRQLGAGLREFKSSITGSGNGETARAPVIEKPASGSTAERPRHQDRSDEPIPADPPARHATATPPAAEGEAVRERPAP